MLFPPFRMFFLFQGFFYFSFFAKFKVRSTYPYLHFRISIIKQCAFRSAIRIYNVLHTVFLYFRSHKSLCCETTGSCESGKFHI